jgi:predicted naringenin-chalcone synthase
LLVAVELCSLHYQYDWSPERIIANALFSDGAAAVIVTSQEMSGPRVVSTFSQIVPNTLEAMSWRIGDHGFRMTLSPKLPALVEEHTGSALQGWLAKNGLACSEIDGWAIHPGGPKVLDAAASALGLDRASLAASRRVLAECGNMSSPTVLFVLDELQKLGRRGRCVLLGFGPGLTIEAALLEYRKG